MIIFYQENLRIVEIEKGEVDNILYFISVPGLSWSYMCSEELLQIRKAQSQVMQVTKYPVVNI